MKKLLLVVSFLAAAAALVSPVYAASFSASVTLPSPVDVSPVATKVLGKGLNTSDWQASGALSLDFDPMTLFTFADPLNPAVTNSIFLPDHFYAIDVGYVYGTGTAITGVVVTYSQAQATGGLGTRATATFAKKTKNPDGTEAAETFVGPGTGKVRLLDLLAPGAQVTLTDLAGGWLRLYVGIVAKDPAANPQDPANAEVFAPGMAPGSYTGTLVITSY